ncbi:glycosyl hydrolase [Terriglobus saanensis]|uniref:Coagulation factor 5/8 type domain protein n=1 Tax=Terriglobus saanensis (strain ATCC BAA-1853 / DSM 23119 / SP1PR4) TaxID=401053 RepID=E8UX75_TERSS|nr:glycosyl hydrolase [Terriglobus saanensis]ADV83038.1 coagulation factor 5/8 type domain protein [Terriglobus saanensis SP1PR4]
MHAHALKETPGRFSQSRIATILCICFVISQGATAQSDKDTVAKGFETPPSSAQPRVWWHWMNGNISKEGIKLDLEWMHRSGIAGFQNFDAALETPQVVDKRLVYMTPEWKDAFKYATTLADSLGMEEAIAGSPGWSETGGPWVPPSEGMKKYVWSETSVEGGRPFNGKLAHPPSNTGAFQNIGVRDVMDAGIAPPQFYADSAVIAYRRPKGDVSLDSLHAKMTASSGSPDLNLLSDGDLSKMMKLPIPEAGDAWVQWEFPTAQRVRSLTIVAANIPEIVGALTGIGDPKKSVQVSNDGTAFREIAIVPDHGAPEHTITLPDVNARFIRVVFERGASPHMPSWAEGIDPASLGFKVPPKPTGYEVAELSLHVGARVNRFEEKAAFTTMDDIYGFATPTVDKDDSISKADVIDLTGKMQPDGTLDWTPPVGDWVVLRFGYSLLGITNHPATKEATGLEVDKLNHAYVKKYMNGYLDSYKETVGADWMGKRGIRYVITDSWEAGSQNWTDNMIDQFKKRRGYDPLPWMPVLTGHVVESAPASDQFLWDFRKTIADLIADEHYGQVQASLKARNIGHYGESHESGRAFVADGMEVKKLDDIPMAAMWTQTPGVNHEQFAFNADDRESASVAHIYGQNLVAAESMTAGAAPWAWSPSTLKPTADQEFLNGINRFVIHESAHQPLIGKAPGLTLGPFGQWFNRNETWAEQARPWIDYLARTSYLLQQGHFGADVVYFYGEDSNLTAIFKDKAPNIPAGYGFDYINADGLIHELKASNGRITTASGMSYRVLGLDPYSKQMSLPVLRAIHKLVEEGATLAGPGPEKDPSLADDHAEFARLSRDLFGDGTGIHKVGKGIVYAGQSLDDVFHALNLKPDFDYTKPGADTRLLFVHRRLADGDVYFVDNRSDHPASVDASFRVAGKVPQLWHAETGKSEPVSYAIADGHTTVPLKLEPWGTVFVVFREKSKAMSYTVPATHETELAILDGHWDLSFQPDRGAPATASFESLISWPDSSDAGIKYFSGTGTYSKTINASADWLRKNTQIWLDLGDVKNIAEVTLNGKSLGQVWHAPYRVNLTSALKPGKNELSVKVTNAWVNRLIGDQQSDAKVKYTFADVKPYKANSPLLPSGLLGPVKIYGVSH